MNYNTDAGLYITRIYVNRVERKLSNAEGYGMRGRNGHIFSGPEGYHNKTILNSHMRKGDNEIKVVFEPSPIIADIINKDVQELFIEDIFARAVIVRGQLVESGLGISTENLDELLAIDRPKVNVLEDKLIKDISKDSMNSPKIVTFNITVPENETEHHGQIQSCKGEISSSYNFTGLLLLNNTPILSIENNTSSTLEPFDKIVVPLENTLELRVFSINNQAESSHFDYYVECYINDILEKASLKTKYPNASFGDFFDRLQFPL
jgi:hypothetical protein